MVSGKQAHEIRAIEETRRNEGCSSRPGTGETPGSVDAICQRHRAHPVLITLQRRVRIAHNRPIFFIRPTRLCHLQPYRHLALVNANFWPSKFGSPRNQSTGSARSAAASGLPSTPSSRSRRRDTRCSSANCTEYLFVNPSIAIVHGSRCSTTRMAQR